jgi:hypothetical protein
MLTTRHEGTLETRRRSSFQVPATVVYLRSAVLEWRSCSPFGCVGLPDSGGAVFQHLLALVPFALVRGALALACPRDSRKEAA